MGEAAAATASASSLGAGAEVSTAELAPSSGYRDPTAPGHVQRSRMRRQASISEEATSEMAFATAAALKQEGAADAGRAQEAGSWTTTRSAQVAPEWT